MTNKKGRRKFSQRKNGGYTVKKIGQ